MLRFLSIALPLVIILLAVFGVVIGALDLEPRSGSVIRLALYEQPRVPPTVVLGAWLMEACGLLALFLVTQGRCGTWWLDGMVAGWLAWVFRGPLLVLTVVVATGQPQDPWWRLAFAWWILYSLIGLSLGWLARPADFEEAVSAGAIETRESSPTRLESEPGESEEPPGEEPEAGPEDEEAGNEESGIEESDIGSDGDETSRDETENDPAEDDEPHDREPGR